MLHKVGPSLLCWCYLGFFASLAWLFSCLKMDFLNKSTGVVANVLVRLTIILSWFVLNVLLHKAFLFFLGQPRQDRLFRGYKRLGKTVGSALLFCGNIGLYYYSEKSIACMLTFLILALHCLCALFCIQPYTDFGVLEFLLGASLNQGLCLFGIHSYSFWFVFIACIVVVGLRYCLEPTNKSKSKSKFEMESDSNLTLPVQLEIGSNLALPPVRFGFKWDQMQVWQFLQFNDIFQK
ncbi:hypothetical protein LOK49_LG12G01762 [Camellia lanceoleosa]|uniref:Uncharacterized protein n=1 Tax=Camellia lanceoleosa TaxID=1840588 RepID=A0ACC0FV09_9ERIC|nr:hypothetical protein LOK49_LG12G01762 [Camellia lanceoleosa]